MCDNVGVIPGPHRIVSTEPAMRARRGTSMKAKSESKSWRSHIAPHSFPIAAFDTRKVRS